MAPVPPVNRIERAATANGLGRVRPHRERCEGGLTPTLTVLPTASTHRGAPGHGMSEIRSTDIRCPLARPTTLDTRWSLAS